MLYDPFPSSWVVRSAHSRLLGHVFDKPKTPKARAGDTGHNVQPAICAANVGVRVIVDAPSLPATLT